jgi:hypothetical protein
VRLALLVGEVGAEGDIDTSPLLLGHLLAGVAAPYDLCDLAVGHAAEPFGHLRRVPAGEPWK